MAKCQAQTPIGNMRWQMNSLKHMRACTFICRASTSRSDKNAAIFEAKYHALGID
ncbi:hypothetical protein D3C87_1886460 [compost metagenome]